MWNIELDLKQLDTAILNAFLAVPDLPLTFWQAVLKELEFRPA